jgi:hypothetical protein
MEEFPEGEVVVIDMKNLTEKQKRIYKGFY